MSFPARRRARQRASCSFCVSGFVSESGIFMPTISRLYGAFELSRYAYPQVKRWFFVSRVLSRRFRGDYRPLSARFRRASSRCGASPPPRVRFACGVPESAAAGGRSRPPARLLPSPPSHQAGAGSGSLKRMPQVDSETTVSGLHASLEMLMYGFVNLRRATSLFPESASVGAYVSESRRNVTKPSPSHVSA